MVAEQTKALILTDAERDVYNWLEDEVSRDIFLEYKEKGYRHVVSTWVSEAYRISKKDFEAPFILAPFGVPCSELISILRTDGLWCNCCGIWDINPAIIGRKVYGVEITEQPAHYDGDALLIIATQSWVRSKSLFPVFKYQ